VSSCGNESRYKWNFQLSFGFGGPILQIPLGPLEAQNKHHKAKRFMKFHEVFFDFDTRFSTCGSAGLNVKIGNNAGRIERRNELKEG
jgi:hypothetical protein